MRFFRISSIPGGMPPAPGLAPAAGYSFDTYSRSLNIFPSTAPKGLSPPIPPDIANGFAPPAPGAPPNIYSIIFYISLKLGGKSSSPSSSSPFIGLLLVACGYYTGVYYCWGTTTGAVMLSLVSRFFAQSSKRLSKFSSSSSTAEPCLFLFSSAI